MPNHHFHIWYKPIIEVIVPHAPTTLPETAPAFKKE